MKSMNDPKMFYKFVKKQRKSSNTKLHTLVVDSKECETQDQISEGWAFHFQQLAPPPPLENYRFDQSYKQLKYANVEII